MSRADEQVDPAHAGCQLLLIGPPSYDPARLAEQLAAALAVGGVAGFVLPVDVTGRHPSSLRAHLAPIRAVCAQRGTACLVRDHVGPPLRSAPTVSILGAARPTSRSAVRRWAASGSWACPVGARATRQ